MKIQKVENKLTVEGLTNESIKEKVLQISNYMVNNQEFISPILEDYCNNDDWVMAVKVAVKHLNKEYKDKVFQWERVDGVLDISSGYCINYTLKVTKNNYSESFERIMKKEYVLIVDSKDEIINTFGEFIGGRDESYPYIKLMKDSYGKRRMYVIRGKEQEHSFKIEYLTEEDVLGRDVTSFNCFEE